MRVCHGKCCVCAGLSWEALSLCRFIMGSVMCVCGFIMGRVMCTGLSWEVLRLCRFIRGSVLCVQVYPAETWASIPPREVNGVQRDHPLSVRLDVWCVWQLRHSEVLWVWHRGAEADISPAGKGPGAATIHANVRLPRHPESPRVHSTGVAGVCW